MNQEIILGGEVLIVGWPQTAFPMSFEGDLKCWRVEEAGLEVADPPAVLHPY